MSASFCRCMPYITIRGRVFLAPNARGPGGGGRGGGGADTWSVSRTHLRALIASVVLRKEVSSSPPPLRCSCPLSQATRATETPVFGHCHPAQQANVSCLWAPPVHCSAKHQIAHQPIEVSVHLHVTFGDIVVQTLRQRIPCCLLLTCCIMHMS